MANTIEITDLSIEELAVYTRMTDAQMRSKLEPEKGIFIAESVNVIQYALNAGCKPISLLMEKKHIETKAKSIIEQCGDVPVYTASSEVLQQLTGFALTRGILCAMHRPAQKTVQEAIADAKRVAVLEGIVDTTNMGAIFRCAAALGMDAVLLDATCCDVYARRSLRVSMGTVFQVPWARFEKNADGHYLDVLHQMGFESCAMALNEHAISIEDDILQTKEKLAIVLGTEGHGLSPITIDKCTHCVMIPMYHGVDSLNVAAASAVAFWQLRAR